jgi:hypothetical protein
VDDLTADERDLDVFGAAAAEFGEDEIAGLCIRRTCVAIGVVLDRRR